MIRVVLDTNQLPRSVSSTSAAFKWTLKLIQEGVLKILMPEIIAEEWRTQQLEHMRKHFQKAAESLKILLEDGHINGHSQLGALSNASPAIDQMAADVSANCGLKSPTIGI
jgi:hypothetical protein